MIPGMFAAGAARSGGSGGGDPHWANVVSLLHFDGADGSTNFPDEKGRIWTPSGNVQVDTVESVFGGSSCLFDGNGDYLTTPSDPSLSASGDVDMTWEAWVRPGAAKSISTIATRRLVSGGSSEWLICLVDSVPNFILWGQSNNTVCNLSSSEPLEIGAWTHLAITVASGTARVFHNGTIRGSQLVSGSVGANTRPVIIGRDQYNSTRDYVGHIEEYRQTRGVARYVDNFTPPNAPFPNGP